MFRSITLLSFLLVVVHGFAQIYNPVKWTFDHKLDGDEHGPLALKMIATLCGDDDQKWSEVLLIAKKALEKRLKFWDGINTLIVEKEQFASI